MSVVVTGDENFKCVQIWSRLGSANLQLLSLCLFLNLCVCAPRTATCQETANEPQEEEAQEKLESVYPSRLHHEIWQISVSKSSNKSSETQNLIAKLSSQALTLGTDTQGGRFRSHSGRAVAVKVSR